MKQQIQETQMVKLTLNLPEEEYHRLLGLMQQDGRTMADFMRVALTVGQLAYESANQGQNFGIVSKDGQLLRMFEVK